MNTCIVCGNKYFYPTFNPGPQPLAALNLPHTQTDSVIAMRYPMNFVTCAFCSHVYNREFDYTSVPYAEDSNRMYNNGEGWQVHMFQVVNTLLHNWQSDGIAIDIGCGDGQFFDLLLQGRPQARCIGFEPGIDAEGITTFPVVRDYFIPERDLNKYKPSLLVCRHVVEHLENPRDFLANIAFWCAQYDLDPLVLIEVPCIDNSLLCGRIADFLYEHNSNFTLESFNTMFEITHYSNIDVRKFYHGEVLVGMARPNLVDLNHIKTFTSKFSDKATKTIVDARNQLDEIEGPVYFWGGTGKSAAFLNSLDINHVRFPYVVDSDINKVGRFVPGTGQQIRSPEFLYDALVGTIVITTPWRAKDIYTEIKKRGIDYKKLLVLYNGKLEGYTDGNI